jgi:hypothetical protein
MNRELAATLEIRERLLDFYTVGELYRFDGHKGRVVAKALSPTNHGWATITVEWL